MNMKTRPIETEVGIISGCDAIYLDTVSYNYSGNIVTFLGQLNPNLCSAATPHDSWLS
jgi:hypothetical protein